MAEHDLNAVAYATYDLEPTVLPEDLLTNPDATQGIASGSSRSLSPLLGFPALTVPAGFTSASLPVGYRPARQALHRGAALRAGSRLRTKRDILPQ